MAAAITKTARDYLQLLGFRVEDKVTGFGGVVTSVTFDLYGCVQFMVHPGRNVNTGDMLEQVWLDANRTRVTSKAPVMNPMGFTHTQADVNNGRKGPSAMPTSRGTPA